MDKTQREEEEKRINAMNPQQLVEVQKTLEQDLQSLKQSIDGIKLAGSKFKESKVVVDNISKHDKETEVMIPLTSSLYIPGKIEDTEKVIVEVGAGYFIDVTPIKAAEY